MFISIIISLRNIFYLVTLKIWGGGPNRPQRFEKTISLEPNVLFTSNQAVNYFFFSFLDIYKRKLINMDKEGTLAGQYNHEEPGNQVLTKS